MADEIITRQQLVDASVDAESLQKFISGPDFEDVLTRLGQIYPTLAKLVRMLMETGGWKAYETEAILLATTPLVNPSVGYAFDTKKLYLWNGTIWEDEGLSPLDLAKAHTDAYATVKAQPIVAGSDINTFTTSGIYTLSANLAAGQLLNWPLTINGYHIAGILVVYGVIIGGVKLASQTFYPYVDKYEPLFRANSFSDGTWSENWRTLTLDLISNMSRASSTVNMLDPKKVLQGYEVRSDGTIWASATAAISGLIYCFDKESIYVSGLQANTNQRWYRFLRQDGSIISAGTIPGSTTERLINVPSGAYSFQISLKQGNSAPLDISTAQIELGSSKSAYVPFSDGAITHIKDVALATSSVSLNDVAFGKNLFNKNTVILGYEMYNTGNLVAQANSITTAPIRVRGLSLVTVSGLLQNPEIERYGAFKDRSGAVLSIVRIAKTSTQETIPVPINAETFQFSIKQRSTSSPDLNVIQVESGSNATEYESYIKGFDSLNGVPVSVNGGNSEGRSSRAYGAKYLMFGDSITQTGDVDNGDITGTTFRSNWPKFAKDQLSMSDYKNYARSGASFREYAGQLTWQKISHQVQTAIANAENPDIIVLACGTNDANINLGNYTTAMSKTIAELDMSNTAEAMRWSLFKIKENFPNAVCFYCTQLQRADSEMESRLDANNLMVKMAQRYGFNIIDCMTESGIVRDFEVDAEARRYLYDGLHPNVDGQKLQSNLIVSRIVERMSF
ncbi:SGNH/GDSL hydrolase family protein [Acinetobacter baumannii]|nr:SGNH/GDSL hydrolase family protein [Acinetobacter baumannii]